VDGSESQAVRVFIVVPTPMARAGLRSMLEASSDEGSGVEVVGGAASLAASGPGISATDVVLLADEESLEDAVFFGENSPAILVLSEDDRVVPKLRALLPRGWGVLPPDAPPEELEAAVVAVGRGLVVLPEALTVRLLGTPEEAREPPEPLTAREGEVLGLIGRGLSNRLIARELHISEHTVKFHISSLYAKLEVGNRAEAVSRGARYGLISL